MTIDVFKIETTKTCGVGGWKCPCCGPVNADQKHRARRTARRVLKNIDKKERFNETDNQD